MSGALAFDAAWLFAGFLILVVLLAAGITVRRYVLERGGGTVECGLRVPGGSWRLGVAAYQPHELRWYQIFGFLLRPSRGVQPPHADRADPAAADLRGGRQPGRGSRGRGVPGRRAAMAPWNWP